MSRKSISIEQFRAWGRQGAAKGARAGGLARAAKLTPERRKEIGRMGGEAARRYWEEIGRIMQDKKQ